MLFRSASQGPGKFNFVTLVILVALAGAGYWTWKYFPVYFTAWQVDNVLGDGANRSYKIVRMQEPIKSQTKKDLVDEMRKKIVELGVTDPEMTVDLQMEDERADVTCDYSVTIEHVYPKDKVSVLQMHRVATADLKKVNWDK